MRKLLAVLLLSGVVGLAAAANVVERSIEASMRVSGTLEVDRNGAVTSYALDHPEKLPASVVELAARVLPTFRFQPVLRDGQPHAVRAAMNLLVVAKRIDPQHIAVNLRSAHFTDSDVPPTDLISVDHRAPMRYPDKAIGSGVSGTVYVAVRLDHGGHVLDAEAQQVNLRYIDSPSRMARWREVLAKPTLSAVRRYTFHVPSNGKAADAPYFTGILPVTYIFGGDAPPKYGEWNSYVPGPRRDIAWLQSKQVGADANEALPSGAFAQSGAALTLLTPIGDG